MVTATPALRQLTFPPAGGFTEPLIWEKLAAAGVPANYYYSDLPFLALFGERVTPIMRPIDARTTVR